MNAAGGYALSTQVPTRTDGVSFLGWYLDSACTGSPVTAVTYEQAAAQKGSELAKGDTIYVYAKWGTPSVSLQYEANTTDEVGNMPEQNPVTDLSPDAFKATGGYTLSTEIPTRTGYRFGGWYLDDACTGSPVTAVTYEQASEQKGSDIVNGDTVHVYAKWNDWIYRVEYRPGDGHADAANMPTGRNTDGTEDTTSHVQCFLFGDVHPTSQVTVSTVQPTDEGYTFTGWNVEKAEGISKIYTVAELNDSSVSKVLNEGDFPDDDNRTIVATAQWEKNTYTVTYHPNGGTGNECSESVEHGASHTVLANTDTDTNLGYTRDGYEFSGWNTAADGSGTSYAAGSTISGITANVDLYAQWDQLYTMKFDLNGGTSSTIPASKDFGADDSSVSEGSYNFASLVATDPTKTGYTFKGWKNGGDDLTASKKIALSKFALNDTTKRFEATVTAQWELNSNPVKYTVTKPDGATDIPYTAPATTNHNYNETVNVEPVPAADTDYDSEKYTFEGWTTNDVTVNDGTFTMPDKEVNFAGVFTYNEYTVTYQIEGTIPAGVTLTQHSGKFHKGDSVTMLNKDISATGYTFSGWSSAQVSDLSGTTFTMPGKNVVIKGSFAINRYPVIYQDKDGNELSRTTESYASTVTVKAASEMPAAATGYEKADWVPIEGISSFDSSRQFTMPDHQVILKASYTPLYQVEYVITGKPSDVTYAPNDTAWYREGADVSRFADPAYDSVKYTFEWVSAKGKTSGDNVSIGADGKFTMPKENVVITGKFTENPKYSVTYTITSTVPAASEYTLVQDSNTYYEGEPVTLLNKGLHVDGYDFSGWSPYNSDFTMPGEDVALTAYFTAHSGNRVIYLDVNGTQFTAPDALKPAAHDFGATVEMAPASLMPDIAGKTKAAEWKTVSGIAASDISGRQFTMPDNDVVFQAAYTDNEYTVTYQPGFEGSTQPDKVFGAGDDKIYYGNTHEIWDNTGEGAFLHYGHTFAGWELVSPTGYATTGSIEVKDNVTYKAIWDTDYYTLKYDKGIVSELSASSPALPAINDTITLAQLRANSVSVSTAKLQAEGYTFKGWKITNTEDDTKTKTYDADQFDAAEFDGTVTEALFDSSRTATAVALWEAVTPVVPTYTVHYQYEGTVPAGASDLPGEVTGKEPGDPITVADPATAPEGYVFVGWVFEDDSLVSDYHSTDVSENSVAFTRIDSFTMPASDVTLIGQFKTKPTPPVPDPTYTLIYDCNTSTYSDLTGLSNQPADKTLTADDFTDNQYTLTTAYPESDNFRFVCWSRTPNYVYENRITEVALSDFGSDGTCTVYAIWIAKLDVTYTCGIDEDDPAWKNNQIDTTHLFEIDEYTLNYRVRSNEELEHPFVYPGYRITKWKVIEGWENIEFPSQPSGGSSGTAAAPAYRRSGNGDEAHFLQFNTLVILHGNVTVEAVWEPIPGLTVTYHANGGAPDPDAVPNKGQPKKYHSGDTVTVESGSGLAKGTQKFRYWSTTPNDTTGSQQYTAGKTFAINKNTDLYAIYEDAPSGGGDKEYTVTYDPNGGTGTTPTDSNKYKGGETVKVKDKWNLVRTNGTFKEWNTKKDGSGTGYKGDGTDTFTMPASDVTLYAIWTDSNGNIMPSPGTGESDLPLLIAFNMAMLALLAVGFVVIRNRKSDAYAG